MSFWVFMILSLHADSGTLSSDKMRCKNTVKNSFQNTITGQIFIETIRRKSEQWHESCFVFHVLLFHGKCPTLLTVVSFWNVGKTSVKQCVPQNHAEHRNSPFLLTEVAEMITHCQAMQDMSTAVWQIPLICETEWFRNPMGQPNWRMQFQSFLFSSSSYCIWFFKTLKRY